MRNSNQVLTEVLKPMRIVLGVVVAVGFLGSALQAENLSDIDCPINTLAYYQVNFSSSTPGSTSGPCANGILNFSGFGFDSSGDPVSGLKGNGDIQLIPVGPPRGELGNTGFSIGAVSGIFSVEAGQTATYVIDWQFIIDNGPGASGANLGLDPPFGDVTITQAYCVDSFITAYQAGSNPACYTGTDSRAPSVQLLTVTTDLPFASIVFDPAAFSFGNVRTIIQLNGGNLGAGFDAIAGTSSIVVLSSEPEPGTWLLLMGGLMIVNTLRKRIVRQHSGLSDSIM